MMAWAASTMRLSLISAKRGGHCDSLTATKSDEPLVLPLPSVIAQLVEAREAMRVHYGATHRDRLRFTFDGNLVGDIGEALAAEYFGLDLGRRGHQGVDGLAPGGATVQVKTTGTGQGAVFREIEFHADRLLFFSIDFARCATTVIYNGPEAPVRALLRRPWEGQKSVSMTQILELNKRVAAEDRLALTYGR